MLANIADFGSGYAPIGAVRLLGLSANGLAITAARSQRESPAHDMRRRSWIAELGTAGPNGPLDPASVAAKIHRREPADLHRPYPTGKGVWFGAFRVYRPHMVRTSSLHPSKSNCRAPETSSL
jgi:hypothetical protein